MRLAVAASLATAVHLLATVTVATGFGTCCSVRSLQLTSKAQWRDDGPDSPCEMAPLEHFDVTVDAARATAAWSARGPPGAPIWLSFAGDSQLRIQFWRLVAMLGGTEYSVSPNFAKIAFNISDAGGQQRVRKDQDPVTVEAKYMDYKFCCETLGRPDSCSIEIGGDAVTKLHAGFRKVRVSRLRRVCASA